MGEKQLVPTALCLSLPGKLMGKTDEGGDPIDNFILRPLSYQMFQQTLSKERQLHKNLH